MTGRPNPEPTATAESLLSEAREAAAVGDRDRARQRGWQAVRLAPRSESAWLLLASLGDSQEDVAMCLQQALAANPENSFARSWLDRVLPEAGMEGEPEPPENGSDDSVDTREVPPAEDFEDSSTAAPRTVLVVDDSPTVRRHLSYALEGLGVRVVVASTGLEALARVHSEGPDLVILDVGLSHLTGHQICAAIKGTAAGERLPVLMLTGRQGAEERHRGELAGADEYLVKPIESQHLLELVERYLRRHPREAS